MKVIHFITAIDRSLGGVSMYMQLLTKELGKLVELTVVTRPTKDPLLLENCKIEYLPLPITKTHIFIKQWKEILQKEKPDIVHINGIWMIQTWIIQREALKLRIKTYITPHGMLAPWIMSRNSLKKGLALLLYQKRALQKAKALIATAESEKKDILQLGYNSNVIFISSGLDIADIHIKENWVKKRKIIYISRIHVVKGIELLLQAVYKLHKELCEYEIIIVGEGDVTYINNLKSNIAKMGYNNIKFIGGVYGKDKWTLYKEADFFVLPTNTENFGYVIAEALASGTPVITTKGAPWQDIETYNCGIWINRDEESLSYAISKLISLNTDELEKMGKNGRRLIEEKYTAKIVAEKLYQVYTSI